MLTVTTPATNVRLTTVAAVRDHGVPAGEVPDALAETLIDRASALAARYCNRVFATETVRETLRNVSNRAGVYLDRTPVDIASIAITEDGVTLVAGTDFVYDARRGALARIVADAAAVWTASKLVIDYAAGYVLPDDDGERTLPADVEMAALYLIGDMYQTIKNAATGGFAVRSLTLDGVGSVTYDTPRITQASDAGSAASALNAVAKVLLDPYCRVPL